MASILRTASADLPHGERKQWVVHCGARQRARNLKRLRREALREQLGQCEWIADTLTVPVSDAPAPVPDVP